MILQGKDVCMKDLRVRTVQLKLLNFIYLSLSKVERKEISHALTSACSVKNVESTSTAIVAMHEQASENSLGRSTVPNSPVTMQNFASHSQETINFKCRSIFRSKCYHPFFQFQMILYSLLRSLKHILLFHVPQNICN